MKKRLLTKIKVEKVRRVRKRARRRAAIAVKDPKDLRGAKGVLLKSADEVALGDESTNGQPAEQRHPPIGIRSDW